MALVLLSSKLLFAGYRSRDAADFVEDASRTAVKIESSSLPREATAVLAGLWDRVGVDPDRIKRDQLRTLASRVSTGARDVGLHPEELIIAVRASWQERTPPLPTEQRWILTEMIALCIDEYYRRQRINGEPVRADSA